MHESDLIEINGKLPVTDPDQDFYDRVASGLQALNWETFEELTASILKEIGFCDVHKLTRGSQQGKDIVAIWYSRFSLGQRVKFRFQCKHTQTSSIVRKPDVGDSISDFLLQEIDEILIIVTNGSFSNDLIDLFDKAGHRGLYSIAGNQFIRLLSGCPISLRNFLHHTVDIRNTLHHVFDFKDWFETRLCLKKKESILFNLHRFWTEPYVWFFYKSTEHDIQRLWTTVGGEFRLTCYNRSLELQELSGLRIILLDKQELPEFGVVNHTPKGGHQIRRFEIPLSNELGDFKLVPEGEENLVPGRSYNCLIDFIGKDPGVYSFKIQNVGLGGSMSVRETDVYKIAYIPEPPPQGIITLYEHWPNSLLIINTLFSMPEQERGKKFSDENSRFIHLRREENGDVRLYYKSGTAKDKKAFESMPCTHPITDYLFLHHDPNMFKYFYHFKWSWWCDEWLDPTDSLCLLNRAKLALTYANNKNLVHDALLKAHERTPWHPKINLLIAFQYYNMGYIGFAQFHFDVAYLASQGNPVLAGIHYLLKQKFSKRPDIDCYLINLSDELKVGFHNLVNTKIFPSSYQQANQTAFPGQPEMMDYWSRQVW